ncbi:Oidioi.mRNA.OKI2018_I69.chr1.g469.t1.cds [Oikopleura dioica]|uniref:Oidioi.mRNA.OKI2018_I69.chr1.g469.t1.cds n=1 Tax=Oikopleura dioica TaxID=34765 RepID=A0ABN7SU82_OIKDI|nr:Oidioi.mRNA.OKI2018_I69.chr1.g469.t1.cds [Oikopleura dioica]
MKFSSIIALFGTMASAQFYDYDEPMEKRAGDGNFATGMGGRAFNAYTGRRLRAIDGGSARYRQAMFG